MADDLRRSTFQELLDAGVLEIGDGYRAKNEELGGSGPIFLRAGHVTDSHIEFDGVEHFHVELIDKLRPKMSCPGDTVITTKGNSTGRTTFVTPRMPTFVYSPHLSYWRTRKPNVLANGFLRYWSQGQEFIHQLLAMKGSTDMAPYLSLTDQRRLKITLPHPRAQLVIARILGSLDDKIELNRRMNATLEGMARALFQSWFVDFDPVRAKRDGLAPEGVDTTTAALFPSDFQLSSDGDVLPSGWVKTSLGAEIDFQTGFPFESEFFSQTPPGIRLARGMNVKEGEFYWDTQARYWPSVTPENKGYLVQSGDVLIGMDGSKVGKNWVRVRASDLPCLLVQRVARLRASQSIGENFIWILVGSSMFRDFVDAVKTGTSIPHISGGQIKSFPFHRPPRDDNRIFKKFEDAVAPFTAQADKNQKENDILTALRDALLPKLLSGEIRVGDAERLVGEAV